MTDVNDLAPGQDHEEESTANGRRAALRALALGGAGAVAGAVAFGKTAQAGDSGGAQINGNATELGETNTSDAPTIIDFTPAAPVTAGPSAFSAGGYVPPADFPFPAGVGGYGDDTIPNGVHGSTTNGAGHGVVAASLAAAAATDTDPAPMPGLAVASLAGSQIHFVQLAGAVSGPTAGVHLPGELYVDLDGTLWFSIPGAAPDTVRWIKLAGAGTAGSYHPITPARAYDSRQAGYAVRGVLAPNSDREIDVSDAHDAGGTVTTADVVPEGATAVMVNVTAAEQTSRNFLAITPGNETSTETSIVNWEDGATQIANAVVVPLSPTRTVRVYCGDQTGSTHVILDVFGYYL